MIQVTCDNCGRIYRVDENKIKGQKARLKCRACANVIIVTKPQTGTDPQRETAPPVPPQPPKEKTTKPAPQQPPYREMQAPI